MAGTVRVRTPHGVREFERPSMEAIEAMVYDREDVTTPDGCVTESDGTCEHGIESWLLVLGII